MAAILRARAELNQTAFRQGLASMSAGVRNFSASATGHVRNIAGNFARLGAVVGAAAGAGFGALLKQADNVERLSVQFETLLGSADAAKDRLQELIKFAATTPFQLGEVGKASRILEALTGGALSTGKGLRMVGDLAAGTGEDFANMAVHVGRAFAAFKAGRKAGESLARLQDVGAITPQVRNALESMGDDTEKFADKWALLTAALGRFSGNMEKASATASGKLSTAIDNVKQIMAELGDAAMPAVKASLDDLLGAMEKFKGSKAFEDLKARFAAMSQSVRDNVRVLIGTWRNLSDATRQRVIEMAKVLGGLAVAYKLGLVQPIVQATAFMVSKMAAQLALALTNWAAFTAGLKVVAASIGKTLLTISGVAIAAAAGIVGAFSIKAFAQAIATNFSGPLAKLLVGFDAFVQKIQARFAALNGLKISAEGLQSFLDQIKKADAAIDARRAQNELRLDNDPEQGFAAPTGIMSDAGQKMREQFADLKGLIDDLFGALAEGSTGEIKRIIEELRAAAARARAAISEPVEIPAAVDVDTGDANAALDALLAKAEAAKRAAKPERELRGFRIIDERERRQAVPAQNAAQRLRAEFGPRLVPRLSPANAVAKATTEPPRTAQVMLDQLAAAKRTQADVSRIARALDAIQSAQNYNNPNDPFL